MSRTLQKPTLIFLFSLVPNHAASVYLCLLISRASSTTFFVSTRPRVDRWGAGLVAVELVWLRHVSLEFQSRHTRARQKQIVLPSPCELQGGHGITHDPRPLPTASRSVSPSMHGQSSPSRAPDPHHHARVHGTNQMAGPCL